MDIDEESSSEYQEENEIQICISLNGSNLCRSYVVGKLEEMDIDMMADQMVDILETLKNVDKHNF